MKIVGRLLTWMILVTFVGGAMGCASEHLRSDELYTDDSDFRIDADAEIRDTTEARQVLDVVYHYRQALVNKDFGTLNRLVSEDYYDNAGTTSTTVDDYGHGELTSIFEMMAQHAEQIRYEIIVKDVQVDGLRAHVDYEFQYAFQYRIGDKETWDAGSDVNRLEFNREGDQWRITSGM